MFQINDNNFCGFLAGKLGAATNLTRPLLISIRHLPIIHEPKYKDLFILLSNCAPFQEPIIFPGSTTAYQLNSTESPDINHDGVGDVASIKPGKFILTDALITPYPIFVLTLPDGNGNIPCWRDTNHDGKLSDAELSTNSVATAVLMHSGYTAPADSPHRSSIACQTTDPKYLKIMHDTCTNMKVKVIDYVLITEDDANKYLADFQSNYAKI